MASVARADDVHLLPVLGTEALREGAGAEAHASVQRALEVAGWTVIDGAPLAADCGEDPACIGQKVDMASLVSVWARSGSSEPYEVLVTLVRRAEHYDGRAEIGDDIASSAAQAAALAIAALRGERGGELVVAGTPDGANVVVDGQRIGNLPRASARVDDGTHVVSVSHAGYASERHEVTTAGGGSLRVELRAEAGVAARENAWPSFVLGGVALVGGALSLGFGLRNALRAGDCEEEGCAPSDGVVRRYVTGPLTALEIGLGAVGIIAGGVVLALRPWRIAIAASPAEARLALHADF